MGTLTPQQLQQVKTIDIVAWYNESRALLDSVYDFPGFTLSKSYINKNKILTEHRLLYAGIRLAAMLDTLLPQEKPKTAVSSLPNSISADSAVNYVDKNITVCTKVFSIKSLDNVSFIDVGAAVPKSPQ